jgi:hypothetical protein
MMEQNPKHSKKQGMVMGALAKGWVVIGSATVEDEEEQWFLGDVAVSGREHGSFGCYCCCFGHGKDDT